MQRICLFCGASAGADPAHLAAATALGTAIAEAGMGLVYGAGDAGLMGAAAGAARTAGGRILGVIPRHLAPAERLRGSLDGVVVTQTMHERKALMFGNSDAAVVLPGGMGTLDELVEILTWRGLGLHARPVVVLNLGGYWDPFLALIDHMGRAGYLHGPVRAHFTVVEDVAAVMAALQAAELTPVDAGQ